MQHCDRSICWLRRDLRLSDHRALHEATRCSREVIPVFVFDPEIVGHLPAGALKRLGFLRGTLHALDQALEAKKKGVLIVTGDPRRRIPEIARQVSADAVFWNRDYEPWAKERDAAVSRALDEAGLRWHAFKDQVVFEGGEILSGQGTPYRVFSAYERAWRRALGPGDVRDLAPDLSRLGDRSAPWFRIAREPGTVRHATGSLPSGWEPGEAEARMRLRRFLERVDAYGRERDYPALGATSRLSPYLRFGAVSIRELFRLASRRKSEGARKWESELIWREFFFMVLDQFPHVAHGPFRHDFASLRWPGEEAHFEAWREGRTGYPLVDAAMRCLVRTGWIHNRLRMVVATFLVKDLLIDWRRGEEFFAEHLIDHDPAANNGGWQWCASTGADAQPWFRIFNPLEQSRRFDPDGRFIREHCPELDGIEAKEIHFPSSTARRKAGYPAPIVDHAEQREKALALYGDAVGKRITSRRGRAPGSDRRAC